ncbi:MAG: YerC/YecD family TrpR-related protein [Clostridia bacterium]|nr:YerC/YecD family TrpR-related protein [Clostridia bacterium]
MNENKSQEMMNELFQTILSLNTLEDCEALFADLCTFKEIEQMSQRIRAARLLLNNKTYSQVIADTEISSATLSRVSRCIQHGSGGYKKFVK